MASVVRFPVVLFDLDGTVVDSGSIILASMRHATREVLGREYEDAELMQAVGGPGLEAQMEVFGPDRVDELVRVYRAHNEPLHGELEACAGMEDVLIRLHEEGRRRSVVRPSSSRSRGSRSGTCSRRSSEVTRPSDTSRIRSRCSSRRAG